MYASQTAIDAVVIVRQSRTVETRQVQRRRVQTVAVSWIDVGLETWFVIAHRLSTIRDADRIVVIENGQIIETGTHDALIATDTRYREMVAAQTSRYQDALS